MLGLRSFTAPDCGRLLSEPIEGFGWAAGCLLWLDGLLTEPDGLLIEPDGLLWLDGLLALTEDLL